MSKQPVGIPRPENDDAESDESRLLNCSAKELETRKSHPKVAIKIK